MHALLLNSIALVGSCEEPEKTMSSTDHIKFFLGSGIDIDSLKKENRQMIKRMKELDKTVEDLSKSLKEARGVQNDTCLHDFLALKEFPPNVTFC